MIYSFKTSGALLFGDMQIELKKGLTCITGQSGAGKSVFLKHILSSFGRSEVNAGMVESFLERDLRKYRDIFNIDLDEENRFGAIKNEKSRYYINSSFLSKKSISEVSELFLSILDIRDKKELENNYLLDLLDNFIIFNNSKYKNMKKKYEETYKEYKELSSKIRDLEKVAKNRVERVEFLEFEVEKLEKLNLQDGELEDLLEKKTQLSKREKIIALIEDNMILLERESSFIKLFDELGLDSEAFSTSLNELRIKIDDLNSIFEDMNDDAIEELLNRIEGLSSVIKRFGDISSAKTYLEDSKKELKDLQNFEEMNSDLKEGFKKLSLELERQAKEISSSRNVYAKEMEKSINELLLKVFIPPVKIVISNTDIDEYGIDNINLIVNNLDINKLSLGEMNRLRLAIICISAKVKDEEGVVFIDEIDANLSGEESEGVAILLKEISNKYQVFSITHQPHIPVIADNHIVIEKKDNKNSTYRILDKKDRVDEVARIVSGKNITKEAIDYAKSRILE